VKLVIFVCDPWESYIRSLMADGDRQEIEWNRDEDLEREAQLAAEFVEEPDAGEDWPWYADLPYEVCEPQVFG
jgi:hypothetical protein